MEDRDVGALDDGSLSEQTFPLQGGAGLRYSTLISAESSRDGKALQGPMLSNHFKLKFKLSMNLCIDACGGIIQVIKGQKVKESIVKLKSLSELSKAI